MPAIFELTNNPAENMRRIREALLERRQELKGGGMVSDAKRRARRAAAKKGLAIDASVLSPDAPNQSALTMLEAMLAEHLQGSEFEKAQRLLEQIQHEAGVEHDGEVVDEREDEPDEDRDEQQRAKRREVMKMIAERARDEWGYSEDQLREEIVQFPRNGLEHLGRALDEDAESVLEELGLMGGGPLPAYRDKATDRKRRAHDRKLALDAKRERLERRDFLKRFPEAARLESRPGDFANFGDQPPPEPLAMDDQQSDGDDHRFEAWFGASRIGVA